FREQVRRQAEATVVRVAEVAGNAAESADRILLRRRCPDDADCDAQPPALSGRRVRSFIAAPDRQRRIARARGPDGTGQSADGRGKVKKFELREQLIKELGLEDVARLKTA